MHLEGKTDLGVYLWKMLKSDWGMCISLHICFLLLEIGIRTHLNKTGHGLRRNVFTLYKYLFFLLKPNEEVRK